MIPLPSHREPIPIRRPLDRVGQNYATVDPGKIVAVVETNEVTAVHHSAPRIRPAKRSPSTWSGSCWTNGRPVVCLGSYRRCKAVLAISAMG